MDFFEDDGVDNHELLATMQRAAGEYVDAYFALSKPIRRWLDSEYRMGPGLPVGLMAIHVELATACLAELMGVEEPPEYDGVVERSEGPDKGKLAA